MALTKTKIGLFGLLALALISRAGKAKPADLVRGQAYRAVFEVPDSLKPHMGEVAQLLPPGSDLVLDGSSLQVRFIAPTSLPIGDVETPFGTLRLVSIDHLD